MAQKLSQNLPDGHQTRSIELRGFTGLSLKADIMNRPPTSWQQLDDCDLFIDGSVRNFFGWALYGSAPTGAPYEAIFEYRPTDSAPRQIWGFCGSRSTLNRIDATAPAVPLASPFVIGRTPWIGLLPGIKIPYNIRKWFNNTTYALGDAVIGYAADGNLYIFSCFQAGMSNSTSTAHGKNAYEPAWPFTFGATIADGAVIWQNQGLYSNDSFSLNYAVIVCQGGPVQKFDGSTVTLCGVSSPQIQALVRGLITSNGTLNLQFGRYYAWTWFNPTTLVESSPSPVIGPVQNSTTPASYSVNGCYLPPGNTVNPPPYQSYAQVEVILPDIVRTPPLGSGFTHVRFYATLDGGSTLFLIPTMTDQIGNVISDPNSSVRISDLYSVTDVLPIPGLNQTAGPMWAAFDGAATVPPTSVPTADAALTIPAPLQSSNEPPPVNPVWGTIYQGSLYLVDHKDRIRVYYMNPGQFETRGINNFLDFPSKTDAPIMTFVGSTTFLLVSTARGLQQVTGSSPADFARAPIDLFHGVVGKQLLIADGAQLVGLIPQGIVSQFLDVRFTTEPVGPHLQTGFSQLSLIGNDVQPLTDALDQNAYEDVDAAIFDTIGNRVLFLLRSNTAPATKPYADEIIGFQVGVGFYRIVGLPATGLRCLAEVAASNESNLIILGSDANGQIWQMRRYPQGDQAASSLPVMQTQSLPTPDQIDVELRDTQKVFRYLWAEGTNINDWLLDWTVDGGATYAPPNKQKMVLGRNGIGATGKHITLRFTRVVLDVDETSLISYLKLDYEIVGRTQN